MSLAEEADAVDLSFNFPKIAGPVIKKFVSWVDIGIKMLPNLVVAVLVLIVFWVLSILTARATRHGALRVTKHKPLTNFLANLARLAVLALGIILALDVLNLEKGVASILAGLGILGVALGFASQDIAKNLIAGLLLLFWHPFRTGDLIRSGDFFGFIESISMRATLGESLQGHKVILPNKSILGSNIQNFSSKGVHRIELSCGVSYGNNLSQVEELVIKAVESLDLRRPEMPVELFFEEFGSNSVSFTIRFWTAEAGKNFSKARSEAIKAIKQIFDDHEITIPK